MNFDLDSEQLAVKKLVKEFVEKEITPFAGEWDKEEKFPWHVWKKMGEIGILGTSIPEEYDGSGMDYITHAIVAEELGYGCSSMRGTYSVQISLVTKTILAWGNEEQKRKYVPGLAMGEIIGCYGLTEPDSGSDAGSLSSTADKDGDFYILNGNKMWITNAGIANVSIIFAKTDRAAGAKGITAFLVDHDTPGFSTQDIHGKLGLRASNTGEIIMNNVRVPKENVLGEVGKGFRVALAALDNARYTVAAGCVGSAQAALDYAKQHAKQRVQFGKPIAGHQLVQQLITNMTLDVECGRLLVYRTGHMKNKGVVNTRETSMAKYYCSEMVNRVAYNAIQVFGGYGFSSEYPVERIYRDARINTLYEGTSQIQQLIIGNIELGIPAFV
ncbi:MAG: acyl-CoA dehydrogenase family protein [Dethiobacter sp.]|jgi:alkylation response protein AidB-like acyl-CoA dehydrogenase|nr:acyl-CoA dehydrogenase family protein [Dethiobacter sp.]